MFSPPCLSIAIAALLPLAPAAALADCLEAAAGGEGTFAGPGSFTTAEGYGIEIEPADYTPAPGKSGGFAVAQMQPTECLGAGEALALQSAAMRLNLSGDKPVKAVSIAYCAAFPIVNISAGTEMPPAYHDNWKTGAPMPETLADDAGNAVALANAATWNGEIYLEEAELTLTSEAGLSTVLFGLREGFVTRICVE